MSVARAEDSGAIERKCQNLGNTLRTDHRHQQAVDAKRNARAGGKSVVEGGQQSLVDRRLSGAALRAHGVVPPEPRALLPCVGQFVIPVGEFERAQVHLEAFGHRRITIPDARKGGLRRGIVMWP